LVAVKHITLVERAAQIERRLARGVRLPPAEEMRNPGLRRTKRKRRLLAKLREVAAAQGRAPLSEANFAAKTDCAG
jgi:hypothetical protein